MNFMLKKGISYIFGLSVLVALAVFCPQAVSAAPITIAAFEMNGLAGTENTFNATTNNANLQTVVLTRGAGINPSVLANAFSSTAYLVGGNKANSITNSEYLQFEVESKNNYKLSLSAININIRRSGTGPNAYQWQYSLDGFATAGIDVGAVGAYVGVEANGAAMTAVDLSGVVALQNLESGHKVSFRMYSWGATGAAGTWGVGRLAGDDLVVTGNVTLNKIVAFEPNGQTGDEVTLAASTLDSNLKSVTMSRGDGVEPSFLLNAFSSKSYTIGGDKAAAIANGEYMEFKIQAKDCYRLRLDTLAFNARRSATGPNAYQWQYSLDGFGTPGVDIGAEGLYNGVDDDGVAMPSLDLTGVAALQSVKKVTLRLYAWGATNSGGTFAIARLAGDDLYLVGNVALYKMLGFDPDARNGDEVTMDATTQDTDLKTVVLSRGAGIDPAVLLRAFSANNFVVGGVKNDALTNGEYFQFEVEPEVGHHFSSCFLDANIRRSGTGPNAYQWQYSLDGFATAGANVGAVGAYAGVENDGTARPQVNMTGVAALKNINVGNKATFRFYAWGATGAPGTIAIGRLAGDDLSMIGDVDINTYSVVYSAGLGGTLTGSSTQAVDHGSNGTAVTAVPDVGYSFVKWSDDSTDNPRTDTNVTGNIAVTAQFAINTYTLTYTAGPNGSIEGNATQTVNYGADGTGVMAAAAEGFLFVDWSDATTTNPRIDSNVTGNISVTANFSPVPITSGPGAFYPPPAIGSGKSDIEIRMHAVRDIGRIDGAGLNILAFIGSKARFNTTNSDVVHSLTVTDLDLYRNIATLELASVPQKIVLVKGETKQADLDGDAVADVSLEFAGVYINRVELTVKSLSKDTATAKEVRASGGSVKVSAITKTNVFARDLTTGMLGEDVKELQKLLNAKGFVLTNVGPGSPGNETNKFGAFTRIALAKYQKSLNISPAIGYFGPVTRAKVNGK